jgi:hypothetical protein
VSFPWCTSQSSVHASFFLAPSHSPSHSTLAGVHSVEPGVKRSPECSSEVCLFWLWPSGKQDEDGTADMIDIPKRTTPAKGRDSTPNGQSPLRPTTNTQNLHCSYFPVDVFLVTWIGRNLYNLWREYYQFQCNYTRFSKKLPCRSPPETTIAAFTNRPKRCFTKPLMGFSLQNEICVPPKSQSNHLSNS